MNTHQNPRGERPDEAPAERPVDPSQGRRRSPRGPGFRRATPAYVTVARVDRLRDYVADGYFVNLSQAFDVAIERMLRFLAEQPRGGEHHRRRSPIESGKRQAYSYHMTTEFADQLKAYVEAGQFPSFSSAVDLALARLIRQIEQYRAQGGEPGQYGAVVDLPPDDGEP